MRLERARLAVGRGKGYHDRWEERNSNSIIEVGSFVDQSPENRGGGFRVELPGNGDGVSSIVELCPSQGRKRGGASRRQAKHVVVLKGGEIRGVLGCPGSHATGS